MQSLPSLGPLALVLVLVAGAGAPAPAGEMFIESCNLGCSNGSGGQEVTCDVFHIYASQEIRVRFSKPVDLGSVDSSSFRIVDVTNGIVAVGTFLLDEVDSRTLIFRPDLHFDGAGNPVWGFESNSPYQILIPGEAQGDSAPLIQSTDGFANQSRMSCTVLTDLGVPPAYNHCRSTSNSAGSGAIMGWSGSTSITADDLILSVQGAVPGEMGIFFAGHALPIVPAGDGVRCAGGLTRRLLPPQQIDAQGNAQLAFDFAGFPYGFAGDTWYFQFWFRDSAAGGAGFTFSDGLTVRFFP